MYVCAFLLASNSNFSLTCCNVPPLIVAAGEGGVADIRVGDDQLSEQVPHHPRMGRPVHQVQGAPQLCRCHETLTILQGMLYTIHILQGMLYNYILQYIQYVVSFSIYIQTCDIIERVLDM